MVTYIRSLVWSFDKDITTIFIESFIITNTNFVRATILEVT